MSLLVGGAAAAGATVLGTTAALGLPHLPGRLRDLVSALLILPMAIPGVICAVAFFFYARINLAGTYPGLVLAHMMLGLPVQALASGEVVMTAAYSGRLISANATEGKHYALGWGAGTIYFQDYFGVPKGSPNKDAAMAFIASTAQLPRQLAFSRASGYGPTLIVQANQVGPELQENVLTPERLTHSVPRDDAFWSEHHDELAKRFSIWAAK